MIVTVLLFLLSLPGFCRDENRGWLGVFSRKESQTKTYFTHQEVQVRYDFESGSNQQILARFGYLKTISIAQEIGFLLGYIQTGNLVEYRPTLQHVLRGSIGTSQLTLRSRIEWRDWQDSQVNSLRTRFQLSYLKPLSEVTSLLVWDEPFTNLTTDSMSGDRFFERNRSFVGIRTQMFDHAVELGYLNQFVPRKEDLTEHIAIVYLYF